MGSVANQLRSVWDKIQLQPFNTSVIVGLSIMALSILYLGTLNLLIAAVVSILLYFLIRRGTQSKAIGARIEFEKLRFAKIEIDSVIIEPQRQGNLELELAISDYLLKPNHHVLNVFRQVQNQVDQGGRRLFSFAFARNLLNAGQDADLFQASIANQILTTVAQKITEDAEPGAREANLPLVENDLKMATQIEVWFDDRIAPGICWWSHKATMVFPNEATYVVFARNDDYRSAVRQRRLINRGIYKEPGIFERQGTGVLLIHDRVPLLVGSESLRTAMIDINSEKICGRYDTAAAIDNQLRETLGIGITRLNPPIPVTQAVSTDKKGFVRLVGLYQDGFFQPYIGDEIISILQTTSPNFLMRGILTAKNYEEIQILIPSYVHNNAGMLAVFIREQGNFVLNYMPLSGSTMYHYYIRPLPTGTITKWYKPGVIGSHDYMNPDNYVAFDNDVDTRVPFSRGYLMTGVEENWMCLELDIGSPAVGEARVGDNHAAIMIETVELENSLQRFAHQASIAIERPVPGCSQGLVYEGSRNGSSLFIKILDPAHVAHFHTERVIGALLREGLLPDCIKMTQINRLGTPHDGHILTFVTPKCETIANIMQHRHLDFKLKVQLCRQLALFARGLLALDRESVICPDFTLEDTALRPGSTLDDVSDTEQPLLFVFDYGSYMFARNLSPLHTIKKPEYRSPEDHTIGGIIAPEPYQVFVLGLLFLQLMTGNTNATLPIWVDDEDGAYEDILTQAVEPIAAADQHDSIADLIVNMLAQAPEQRPLLADILRVLSSLLK